MNTQHNHQITLVRSSWAMVAPSATAVASLFYGHLLNANPQLRPLFKGDMAVQGGKLMQMIGAADNLLDKPGQLMPVLRGLGARHQGYGVQDTHYTMVGQALLQTLEEGLAEAFTAEVRAAWTAVYGVLAGEMMAGAQAQAMA